MGRNTVPYVVADVFTDTPLQGNQLAVFPDASELSDDQMQALTREINFSECAFVLPPKNGGYARVRVFTPAMELGFAGHPVLGAAFVLRDASPSDEIRLETASGVVTVRSIPDSRGSTFMWMTQPVPHVRPFEREAELLAALGVSRAGLPVEVYDLGVRHVLVALESADAVAALRPDVGTIARLGDFGVCCFASLRHRVDARVFAPALGIIEDPATGTAAGLVALHLVRHGRLAWGERIAIHQGESVGRPSTLSACAHGSDTGVERIEVGGRAVIVARGEFLL